MTHTRAAQVLGAAQTERAAFLLDSMDRYTATLVKAGLFLVLPWGVSFK